MLRSYEAQNLKAHIVIADASDEPEAAAVKVAVDRAARQLDLDYRSYPQDLPFNQRVLDALGSVTTEFAVLGADDDIFTSAGLDSAAEFLQANPGYSAAHGLALVFELEPGPVFGKPQRTAHYTQRGIEPSTGALRLMDHLSKYTTTWYSMQRSQQLNANFRKAGPFDPDYFMELLPSCLSVIQGKTKKLDRLYMLRQVHRLTDREKQQRHDRGLSVFDWITEPDFAPLYRRFEDCLSEELILQDGISRDAGNGRCKECLLRHIARQLSNKWQQRYGPGAVSSPKSRLSGLVPGLPQIWQQGRSLLKGEQNQMLLPALLRASSPYHSDFMPIYRAIQGEGA